MADLGIIALAIGIITFVVLLPVIRNTVTPLYTLNVAVNDSTVFTDEGAVSHGQTDNYPISGQITQCANDTYVFTVPGQCNVSTAVNGTVQVVDVLSGGSTLNISYLSEDARYLETPTQRSIAGNIFIMVILGLFMMAAFFVKG